MKSFVSGSAIVASALLAGSLIFSAQTSSAETPFQQLNQTPKTNITVKDQGGILGASSSILTSTTVQQILPVEEFAAASAPYLATAYTLRGRTASGRPVSRGLIAADPRVLPLGSKVRLEAGEFSGDYLVADTGGTVRGRRVDIWTPSNRQAFRFGRRTVKLTVLSYGPKKGAAKKAGR